MPNSYKARNIQAPRFYCVHLFVSLLIYYGEHVWRSEDSFVGLQHQLKLSGSAASPLAQRSHLTCQHLPSQSEAREEQRNA